MWCKLQKISSGKIGFVWNRTGDTLLNSGHQLVRRDMGSRGGTTQPDNQANMTLINKLTLYIIYSLYILIFLNIYSVLFICCNCRLGILPSFFIIVRRWKQSELVIIENIQYQLLLRGRCRHKYCISILLKCAANWEIDKFKILIFY